MGFTYKNAGVDNEMANQAVRALTRSFVPRKGLGAPLGGKGGFASLIDFGEYALGLCTDGVGSKILVADEMAKWDTVGIDCIAMNVNDLICVGAEPVAFVDYLAVEDAGRFPAAEVGKGLATGARLANVSIVGGETACLPDIVKGFDIAGAALGFVRKEDIIDYEDIMPGDAIIGIPSSGIHSNGYSLVRRILKERGLSYRDPFPGGNMALGLELLKPTEIYVKQVLTMLERFRKKVNGLCNITGGGLRNLIRLKEDVGFEITDPLEPQPVFWYLMQQGVSEEEMYQTFNMGMGFCAIVERSHAKAVVSALGQGARVVGSVVKEKGVRLGDICYLEY